MRPVGGAAARCLAPRAAAAAAAMSPPHRASRGDGGQAWGRFCRAECQAAGGLPRLYARPLQALLPSKVAWRIYEGKSAKQT